MDSTPTGPSVSSSYAGAASINIVTKHPIKKTGNCGHFCPTVSIKKRVLNALLAGKRLTARSVLEEWDVLYLAQVIYNLTKNSGIPIGREYVLWTRADGLTIRYARYFMAPNDIVAIKGGA
jgi:helix-turn-helix protein